MRGWSAVMVVAVLGAGCGKDTDGDGVEDGTDCAPGDPLVSSDADEVCNGIDDDCDGAVDEEAHDATTFFADADADGFGDGAAPTQACSLPEGHAASGDDCDDAAPTTFPGADEPCNGVDDDCSGAVDDGAAGLPVWYADLDADGFGDPSAVAEACDAPSGYVADATDCDDDDGAVHPEATEICNGVDDDCDRDADTGATDAPSWYADADGDGFGDLALAVTACEAPEAHVGDATDCDDDDGAVHPGAAEVCNGLDDDCEGTADVDATDAPTWHLDADADGFGDAATPRPACEAPAGHVADATDCDDTRDTVSPAGAEVCDAGDLDEDCDGAADDDDPSVTGTEAWHPDADADGFGSGSETVRACAKPAGHLADATDCDDDSSTVYPGAAEIVCNGTLEDCAGADADVVVLDTDKIADKLAGAVKGNVVCVYPGTYTGQVLVNKAITLVSAGGPSVTTLRGPLANRALTVRNAPGARITGFTITRGTSPDNGGGVLIERSDGAVLEGNVITGNTAKIDGNYDVTYPLTGFGGGVAIADSTGVIVRNNEIRGNRGYYGGGIGLLEGVVEALIEDNTVTGNDAAQDGGGLGLFESSLVRLVGNTVEGNTSLTWSGGIDLFGGSDVSLEDNVIAGNSTGEFGGGVGVYLSAGAVITGGEVRDNETTTSGAGYGGGVLVSEARATVVRGVVVTGNRSTYGGGVYFGTSNASTVDGSTLTGNEAEFGGGLLIHDSINVPVLGSTLTGNAASTAGGGVFCWGDYDAASYRVDAPTFDGATGKNGPDDFRCASCTSNRACPIY